MKKTENLIKKKLTISVEKIVSPTIARLAKLAGYDWNSIEFANGATLTFGECYKQDSTGQWKIIQPKAYNPKNPHVPAMPQSLLQKWIREVHNIHIDIRYSHYDSHNNSQIWNTTIMAIPLEFKLSRKEYFVRELDSDKKPYEQFYSYEEALEVGLKEALKWIILKEEYEDNIPTKNILDGNSSTES